MHGNSDGEIPSVYQRWPVTGCSTDLKLGQANEIVNSFLWIIQIVLGG